MNRTRLLLLLSLLLSAVAAHAIPTNFVESPEVLNEQNPVVKAIDADRDDLVWAWIQQGHSPLSKIENKLRERLFDRAASHGSVKVCNLLLRVFKYYNISTRLTDSRGTPILVSLAALSFPHSPKGKRYEAIIQDVLKYFPENIRQKDQAYVGDGRTALHEAAAIGNVGLMRTLVLNGADANAKDSIGETPLHFAARFGHLDAVKYLASLRGVDLDPQTSHTRATPLMMAAEMGHREVIRALLALGARRDQKDTFGKLARDRYHEHRDVASRSKRR